MAEVKRTQLELREKLEDLWLSHMEKLLISGEITSTDLATLARVLMQNGWSLDANRLPQSLRDKIPNLPDPKSFDEDDEQVIARIG